MLTHNKSQKATELYVINMLVVIIIGLWKILLDLSVSDLMKNL